MKLKLDYITNSSSTAYIIVNTSDEPRTLVDFVKENPQLIEMFLERYDWNKKNKRFNQKNLVESARQRCILFKSKVRKTCVFGDEDGTLVGEVFDYILRDGGTSKHWEWHFLESRR